MHVIFATYLEWMWAEHDGGPSVQEQFDERYDDREDRIWDIAPGDPGRSKMLSRSVYERGAMTLHALRREIGDPAFLTILKTWADQKRDANATIEEFIALAEQISSRQLDDLFDAWLYQQGHPE